MKQYVLALDQGTTSSRAVLFDHDQQIVGICQQEYPQIYPQAGWVEHDPLEIWSSQYSVMMEAIARFNVAPEEIAAIGITNQRETTIVWDKLTGEPVYNAIVWQCRRTAPICEDLIARGLKDYIRENTGLLIDAYFSGTKIKWILDHVPGATVPYTWLLGQGVGSRDMGMSSASHSSRSHRRVWMLKSMVREALE